MGTRKLTDSQGCFIYSTKNKITYGADVSKEIHLRTWYEPEQTTRPNRKTPSSHFANVDIGLVVGIDEI